MEETLSSSLGDPEYDDKAEHETLRLLSLIFQGAANSLCGCNDLALMMYTPQAKTLHGYSRTKLPT